MTTRAKLALVGLGLCLSACATTQEPLPPAFSESLALPVGNAVAGRQSFIDLSCTSCHTVLGEAGRLPNPVSANAGPMLGPHQANQQLGRLVTSIVSPSHSISPETRIGMEGNLSPMADFSEAMTVRQLIDIVTYLRAQGPPG